MFRELSVAEQRYQAVLTVIEDGLQITEAAAKAGVTRQALHEWLTRYAEGGLEALADRSHRPRSCPCGLTDDSSAPCWSVRRIPTHERLTPCGN